jgi:TetR/AcrR family transcriptional regulator
VPKSPATTTRRSRRSASERRADMLEAARKLFVQSGFSGTSIRDIAAEADVNQGMTYRFFSSKEQLFEEAIAAPVEEAILASLVPATGELEIVDATDRFITGLLQAMQDIAPLFNVVLGDAGRAEHFYRHRLLPSIKTLQANTEANFPVWAHTDFDAGIAIKLICGACWFLALDERYGDGPRRPPEELAREVRRIFLDGLRARSDD